ncbi:YiiX/YebB-like N1pC/P60 family cysteine hydrolase [Pseudohongiella sp. SYSU M77423]|uniref:YiiX/YebB-like N1pC/P60 family cysteine hydrolase n=1 Tax=Pseudohongiella sp. SYSU M77423 TaxID=3042312 RepID=UPI0024805347|nr:YiiX/YebB-like N1pC/P60 family cysteine hydrolase [Pseudohongiella sp. SYSU M77423]MDH7942901.1 YiiX/YebB-like N1pC/P60 family cysteine hydrolase [Pseudohongiella sp. SYSU M77423]
MNPLFSAIGRGLANYLSKPRPGYERLSRTSLQEVMDVLQPGDILLVDGNSRISTAIKYLTQSTWSHACLYVGASKCDPDEPSLIEADLTQGVIMVPLSKYEQYNVRICRPVGISDTTRDTIINFARERLGHVYDLRNIFDLARYLIQKPAVPNRLRRELITFGSGEPTRAICSTLIAEAFLSVGYPILPEFIRVEDRKGQQITIQRHYTHYVPGDFDLSPNFRIVKPTLERGFSFEKLRQSMARDVEFDEVTQS